MFQIDQNQKLSTLIVDIGLSDKVLAYLTRRGVLLVGEAYLLRLSGSGSCLRPDIFGELKLKTDLPPDTNPLSGEWAPHYWADKNFIRALSMSPAQYDPEQFWGEYRRPSWFRGHTMGELLVAFRTSLRQRSSGKSFCNGRSAYSPSRMEQLQKRLVRADLHAAAILPLGWLP